jgi:ribose transport system permease protein
MAAAFTVALISGQVDLTMGALVSTAAITYGVLTEKQGLPLWAGVAVALAVCVVVGLLNGFLIVDVGVNSFIATLSVSLLLTGVALMIPNPNGQGQFLGSTSHGLHDFATATVWSLPVPLLLMFGVYAVLSVGLARTEWGWDVYVTGDNPSAAIRAGISTSRVYRVVLVLTALASGLGALILIGQSNYASPDPTSGTGASLTLTVLAAVLIGGMDLAGGRGRVERTFVGVLLVAVLQNGLVLRNLDSYVQHLATGIVFLLAVVLGSIAKKRKAR